MESWESLVLAETGAQNRRDMFFGTEEVINLLKFRLLEFLRKIAILELEFLTSFLTNLEFDQFLKGMVPPKLLFAYRTRPEKLGTL